MLACLLFALIRFGAPCHIQDIKYNPTFVPIDIKDNPTLVPISVPAERGVIIIDSRLVLNLGILVRTLHHISLPMRFVSELLQRGHQLRQLGGEALGH
jgi:hypothetical protein